MSLEETLRAMTELYLDKKDPVRKAERAVLSSRKPKRVSPKPGRQNFNASLTKLGRQPFNASLKHAVHLRDGFQCTETGCLERRWLDLHHIIPVSEGGLNSLGNIRTLCSRHHAATHKP